VLLNFVMLNRVAGSLRGSFV